MTERRSNDMTRKDFITAGARLVAGAAALTACASLGRRSRTVLTVRTLDGDVVAIDRAGLDELQRHLKGTLQTATVPGYDASRRIWNAAIDRRPAIIVQCVDVTDVAHAVRFAKRHNAQLSVRAGGHNAAGFAICDGGVLIDLTRLNGVTVDPSRKTAIAGGGATFAGYDSVTGAVGLGSTGPIISMVGVGGYTLGGGVGWLHRKLGLACDNLVSAQVVTANGAIVETSSVRRPELFWALRGGGGNFGVVSAFEFQLAPVSHVLAGLIYHPLEDLPQVASFVRDFNASAPDDVCVWLMMRKAPASAALPVEMHGRPVVAIAVCYAGAPGDGERVVQPLRRFRRPLADQVKVRAYADWQRALDGAWGNGFGNHWTGHYLPELTDASAQTMLEHVARVTSRHTDVKLVQLGGAVARVGEHDTAFSYRSAKYALVIQTRWERPADSAEHLAWSREFFDAMKVHGTGKVYVNFMAAEGERRVLDAYNRETFERLRAIKTEYDPRNLFRMNQNIPPLRPS
jgi:FAD/FMN-containing dehydrogenase